jgi:hypothetical protein
LTRREIGILTPIALACLIIGVYPNPLLQSINRSIAANILESRQLLVRESRSPLTPRHGVKGLAPTLAGIPSRDTDGQPVKGTVP